jgi:predicted DNA-binding WGR domain protein
MKLIKRTTLYFQEGTSDKVYEVDLCQVDEKNYVVNFRYGRRGTNLKEGTKTTTAIPLTQAEKVFDKLIKEKTDKGYYDINIGQASQPTPAATVNSTSDPRKQAILSRLENKKPSEWKLERAIWRAGELKITEAEPLLIKLIGTGEALRDYCIAWSLGWCGSKESIPHLQKLYQNPKTPDFVNRIAFDALLKLLDEQGKAALKAEKIATLPPDLKSLATKASPQVFAASLNDYLENGNYKNFAVLDTIYQIDNEIVRPALINILRTAPFKPSYFQRVRHIFKMAEYRHDAEVFGLIAYRFEKQREMFNSESYGIRLSDGQYLSNSNWQYNYNTHKSEPVESQVQEELQKPESRIAYSSKTREYLRFRVWRTLEELGKQEDASYIKMAVGILLEYSDNDAIQNAWFEYSPYQSFNHIIYENSPRYACYRGGWFCKGNYRQGNPEPQEREEAFPKLWEQHPEALIHLLCQSKCLPVHHFAVKALKASPNFLTSLDIPTISQLLDSPYEVTAKFAFEKICLKNYNPALPNKELLLALANCLYQPARNQAYQWIQEKLDTLLTDTDFITSLIISPQSETRISIRPILNSTIFSDDAAKIIVGKIISNLLIPENQEKTFGIIPENIGQRIKDIGETLFISFAPQLRSLGFQVINDLLQDTRIQIQEIGARILLNHETKTENLPPQVIQSLLASPHDSVRVIGIRLFGQLPDEKLVGEDRVIIVAMAINAVAEIREAIEPIIIRLATKYPDFANQIARDFIEVLLLPEKYEGVHNFVVKLLNQDLKQDSQIWKHSISKETTLCLINAKSTAAQELGGAILIANISQWQSEFTANEIVKLSNSQMFIVREGARQLLTAKLDSFRENTNEMLAGVRLLESKWEDTREFAFQLFTKEFTPEEFTPQILISICDSVREEARSFGRDLLIRNFQAQDGQEYLLKFSEHPSVDMQLFTTNYLEKYASGNPARLQELKPFFVTCLSRVNKAGIAKKRIFAFLESEAQKYEESAKIVAEIMARQSLTMAISDKASAIKIMLQIHKKHPNLVLPMDVKEVVKVRT